MTEPTDRCGQMSLRSNEGLRVDAGLRRFTRPRAESGTKSGIESDTDHAGPAWARTHVVIGLIVCWALSHLLLRIFLIPTLGVDHVEQAVAAQGWLLSYGPTQPPAYTWMQQAVFELFGPSIMAVVVPKYLLVTAFLIGFFAAARATGLRDAHAALAVFSLALLYQIGWKFHSGLTHSLLMSLAIALSLLTLVQVVERGRPLDYLRFGAAVGLGIMSKYGFAAFLFALLVAVLTDASMRARISRRGAALSTLVALAICAPLVWFGLTHIGTLAEVFRGTMAEAPVTAAPAPADNPQPVWYLGRMEGLGSLALAVLGFLSPLWLLLVLVYPRVLPGLARPLYASTDAAPRSIRATRWAGFMRRFFCGVAFVLLALVLIFGATRFKERWMHPFLLLAPIAFMHRVARSYPENGWGAVSDLSHSVPQASYAASAGLAPATAAPVSLPTRGVALRHRVMLAVVMFFVVFVLGYRIAEQRLGPPLCGKCRELTPYARLAEALTPHLGSDGGAWAVLAADEHIAGNMRMQFPKRAVFVPHYAAWSPQAFGMVASSAEHWTGEGAKLKKNDYATQILRRTASGSATEAKSDAATTSAGDTTLEGRCVLVWSGAEDGVPSVLRADLAERFATRMPETIMVERVEVPLAEFKARFPKWEREEAPGLAFAWRYAVVPDCGRWQVD